MFQGFAIEKRGRYWRNKCVSLEQQLAEKDAEISQLKEAIEKIKLADLAYTHSQVALEIAAEKVRILTAIKETNTELLRRAEEDLELCRG